MENIYKMLNEGPFVIAEIGSNHNGDIALAKQMIDAAKDAGCNAVKFQSWDWNTLFSVEMIEAQKDKTSDYVKGVGLREIQKNLALSEDDHIELKKYCDEKGIIFSSTPFSKDQIDMLMRVGVPYLKIASLDLNNLELLKHASKQKVPILISIGMGDEGEILKAIETIRNEGNNEIIVLHCVAVYPPENGMVNLNTIGWLKDKFKVGVGFSDHTLGIEDSIGAVALGATVIEKHFMLQGLKCRDAKVSITPEGMKNLVIGVKKVFDSLGSKARILSDQEKSMRDKMRRSVLVKYDLNEGEVLNENNTIFKRPGTGISPDQIDKIYGKKLKVNKKGEEALCFDDME